MKAVTFTFDYNNSQYERLLRVLIKSWRKHGSIPLEVNRIPANYEYAKSTYKNHLWRNHLKLKRWIESVDQDTILMDCDMLCQGDISDGFKEVDHIGITYRDFRYPYNGGVVYVRDTEESQEFLEKWYEIDERMILDSDFHDYYHDKYAGLNQASMGWMLENGYDHLVEVLPCSIYNLCKPWRRWRDAKMIHIKSELREQCLYGGVYPHLKGIVDLWRKIEAS